MGGEPTLDVTHPQLAAELLDVDPRTLVHNKGVAAKYSWRCPNHPEPYTARLGHRVSAGSGCPYCAGMKVLPGLNDLATKRPDLAAELIDADPTQVLAGGNTPYQWRCPNHPEPYTARVKARIDGYGCNVCRKKQVHPGINDLATTHPDLASELLDIDPTTITSGSPKVGLWRCPNHPEPYPAKVKVRTQRSRPGCPYCAGRAVLIGYNDLATTHPDIAATLLDPDPTTVTAGSSKQGLWRCPNHPEPYTAQVSNRTYKTTSGCGYCRGLQVLIGFNDLATTHPDIAATLLDPEPTTVTAGSNKTATWRCPNHPEPYTAKVSSRVNGNGCGYCGGKKVLPGYNDMATTHPQLAAEVLDVDPTTVFASTGKRLRWRCERGHEYEMTGDARANPKGGRGCPYCNNHQVLPGYNDLATTHPDLAAELLSPDPTTVVAGTLRKGRWQCRQCGKQWNASMLNRSRAGSGCPSCNKGGYNSTEPGYLYLMERPGEQQVGITNDLNRRLRDHRRQGWEVLDVTNAMNGERVVAIELEVRHWLRDNGWRLPGTFENWSTANLEVATLRELFDAAGVTDPATGTAPNR